MIIVHLIRHAERAFDKEDQDSSISLKGKNDCIQLKSFFYKIGIKPKLFLCSSHVHAIDTAGHLKGELVREPVSLESLTPENTKWTLEDILEECDQKKVSYSDCEEIALVGHEGRLSRLLTQITSERFRPFNKLDMVSVKAENWNELRLGRGVLFFRYPANNFQEDKLQSKVQSKMGVATFLAGFNFTILSTLVTSGNLSKNNWSYIGAFICLVLSLFLFISAVYIYDSLSMPPGFWVDQDRPKRKEWWSKNFKDNVETSGPQYAYMIQTWNIFFTPAVLLSLSGFIFLLLSNTGSVSYWLLLVVIILFFLVLFYYNSKKPKLGCD